VTKKRRQRTGTGTREGAGSAAAYYEQLLTGLWQALTAGDLFRAELETARVATIMQELSDDGDRADSILVDVAVETGRPEDAALLRLMVLLGSPAMKRKASEGLGQLTAAGVYPAEWAAGAGQATPLRAWRRYCVFGDWEQIFVSFGYAGAEHAFSVAVALTDLPVVRDIELLASTDDLPGRLAERTGEYARHEEITLADARRRIEEPLELAGDIAGTGDAYYLPPVLRSRLRRLPAAAPDPSPGYTAADRGAAVTAFLGSTEAADAIAADEAATRFWAEVLTGYSSRLRGEPPAQVGIGKLTAIMCSHVPEHFELTEAQRRHMPVALTAWMRWSAGYRGLGEEAAAYLAGALPGLFKSFGEDYDEDIWSYTRGYVADVVTSDVDVAWLREVADRRGFAVAQPWDREYEDELTADLDVRTPAGRHAGAAAEFATCDLPDGATREDFIAAIHQVIEELWAGEPAQTWELAEQLTAAGLGRHDVIHELERRARSHPG
jgi:hypothetical protein